jgi:class 3 adenylate cyclase
VSTPATRVVAQVLWALSVALGVARGILVSSALGELVAGSDSQLQDRGVFALKGIAEERRLFAGLEQAEPEP